MERASIQNFTVKGLRGGGETHPCPFPLTRLPVAFPCLGREIIIGCLEFSRDFISFDDRLIFNVSSDEVQWMILWLPFDDRLMGNG